MATFNLQQRHIFDTMMELCSRQHYAHELAKTFLLDAPAGTGKTFLVKELYKHIGEHHPYRGVKILCPTNKSKSLFHNVGGINEKDVMTIHKFLDSSPIIEEADGNLNFVFHSDDGLYRNEIPIPPFLVIIDEASMISNEMLTRLKSIQRIERFHILFTCDRCQLPPVNEMTSGVYDMIHARFFVLEENMRSNKSPCQSIVSLFREQCISPNGTRPILDTMSKRNLVSSYFKDAAKNCVILAWTNERKTAWNNFIRKQLIPHDGNTELPAVTIGEELIFSGNRKAHGHDYTTSDIIKIVHTKIISVKLSLNDVFNGCEYIDVKLLSMTDQYATVWFMPCYKLDRCNVEYLVNEFKKKVLQVPLNEGRGKYWKKFYNFKEKYLYT